VRDFKSLAGEHSIEVRPLTILAGANSSGKSSIMQPLLLMKQTLEAPYNPGALLLDGPIARFTDLDQILPIDARITEEQSFSAGFELDDSESVESTYRRDDGGPVRLIRTVYRSGGEAAILEPGPVKDELKTLLERKIGNFLEDFREEYEL